MMPESLTLQWFVVWAAVVGVISLDLSKAKVFAWLRKRLPPRDPEPPSFGTGRHRREWDDASCWERSDQVWYLRQWLASLIRCPWCLAHWVSMIVCLAHGLWNPLWWLALTGASALAIGLLSCTLWLIEDPRLGHD